MGQGGMKTFLLRSLARLGLLPPTYRGYEQLRGSDFDGPAVEWCRKNLAFASFTHNELRPPLPFGERELDLVYAFSVLTHLPVDVQHAWVAELGRVLRPGGYLLLSTHGERYL